MIPQIRFTCFDMFQKIAIRQIEVILNNELICLLFKQWTRLFLQFLRYQKIDIKF